MWINSRVRWVWSRKHWPRWHPAHKLCYTSLDFCIASSVQDVVPFTWARCSTDSPSDCRIEHRKSGVTGDVHSSPLWCMPRSALTTSHGVTSLSWPMLMTGWLTWLCSLSTSEPRPRPKPWERQFTHDLWLLWTPSFSSYLSSISLSTPLVFLFHSKCTCMCMYVHREPYTSVSSHFLLILPFVYLCNFCVYKSYSHTDDSSCMTAETFEV